MLVNIFGDDLKGQYMLAMFSNLAKLMIISSCNKGGVGLGANFRLGTPVWQCLSDFLSQMSCSYHHAPAHWVLCCSLPLHPFL